jgi:hypothetical protein
MNVLLPILTTAFLSKVHLREYGIAANILMLEEVLLKKIALGIKNLKMPIVLLEIMEKES